MTGDVKHPPIAGNFLNLYKKIKPHRENDPGSHYLIAVPLKEQGWWAAGELYTLYLTNEEAIEFAELLCQLVKTYKSETEETNNESLGNNS